MTARVEGLEVDFCGKSQGESVETRRSLVVCRAVATMLAAPFGMLSQRSRRWRWPRHYRVDEHSLVALVALVVAISLMGCGGGPTTTSRLLTLSPSAAATLSTATTAVPSATASIMTPATPASTVSPSPAVTASPTATPMPPTATATAEKPAPTPAAVLYTANFATWFAGEETAPYPSRSGYDPASNEYSLALTDPSRQYGAFRYGNESPRLAEFQLDIDARAVAGPVGGSYGVVFHAVPPGSGEQAVAQQLFFVTNDGRFFLTQIDAAGHGTALAPPTTSGAIKTGTAVNHLTVVCKGAEITLAINGQVVGAYSAATVVPGGFGVGVSNPRSPSGPGGMAAAFTNLRVSAAP